MPHELPNDLSSQILYFKFEKSQIRVEKFSTPEKLNPDTSSQKTRNRWYQVSLFPSSPTGPPDPAPNTPPRNADQPEHAESIGDAHILNPQLEISSTQGPVAQWLATTCARKTKVPSSSPAASHAQMWTLRDNHLANA